MNTTVNIIIAVATVVCAVALFAFVCFDKKRFSTRSIAYGAICLALSFGLSYIRIFRMPQGGSVTAASMLPIMVYSYVFGPKKGVLIGLAYAGLQSLQDLFFVSFIQYLLDYPIAFMAIGLVGLGSYLPALKIKPSEKTSGSAFVEKIKKLLLRLDGYPIGFFVAAAGACLLRFVCHTLSGVVFFAEYAGGENVWIYSLGYNSFVWVECAICVAAATLLFANRTARKFIFSVKD